MGYDIPADHHQSMPREESPEKFEMSETEARTDGTSALKRYAELALAQPLSETPAPLVDWEAIVARCYLCSVAHGFWDTERNKAEQHMLIVTEVAEMTEGVRKPGNDQHCPQFTSEEVEAADILIRVFDYAHGHGLRLLPALLAKMEFNESRPYKHGKTF